MLRKVRIILAVIFFSLITLLFLDFTGVLHTYFGWLAKLQFFPAIMAFNVGVIVAILLLTLLFGRVYCSVICPLGVMQDGISNIGGRFKKNRFHFTKAKTWLRWGLVGIFVALVVLGFNAIASIIAPYSAYGRIASSLFAPIYQWGNNLLAFFAERLGSYAFYHVDVWIKSGATLIVSIVTFLLIGFLAFRNGRVWCTTICPVGTVLGLVSKYAIFKPVINVDKCNGCTRCARNCKSSCINPETHEIDYSRCVACMDCLENCSQHAISIQRGCGKKVSATQKIDATESCSSPVDESKRKFILTSAMVAATAAVSAQEKKFDGGLAVIEDKKIPTRNTPIKPAGSTSLRSFSKHCTSCQLCVSECPNHVLRPSQDLSTFMQPEMSYERGYCRPECTRCSEVCPTGAIRRIDVAEKSSIHIGVAVVVAKNCIVNTDGVTCGNCARHCPANAIVMVPKNPGDNPDLAMTLKVPTVDESRCIGCGACENLCPARPFSAIYVEGREDHIQK